ncbi:MAG: 1-acyl-sn-glycerol-3-phosphate acyltransferase [Actinomycetota bacterium]|nr:1-acyl-sn-glycerol-3-phosphate acyltransferase [Actinomycetota bacterium]
MDGYKLDEVELKEALRKEHTATLEEQSSRLESLFGWKPAPIEKVAIRFLSKFMLPLEEGSYTERPLPSATHIANLHPVDEFSVFALRRASYLNKLILAARLRRDSGFNIVEIGEGGERKSSPGLGVARKRTRGKRTRLGRKEFESLEKLIEIQEECPAEITITPIAVTAHQLIPDAPSNSVLAKLWRAMPQNLVRKVSSRVRLLRSGSLEACENLSLGRWLRESFRSTFPQQAAKSLRIELAGRIESECRVSSGPPRRPLWEVKRKVLSDPRLCSFMEFYALSEGLSSEEVMEEALRYLQEIASDVSLGVMRRFVRFVDFLFDHLFSEIEVNRKGMKFLRECENRKRIVLVCSHKSYLDPLLLGYAMYRSGMMPPQQAAGLNLNFWPAGWILRHSGAFYLPRSFKGRELYREVFSAYVRYLLSENYITAVYIEGTRSRDGKLSMPKLGFLKILADSLKSGACEDIVLVPVYLGYDKVPEEAAHVREMLGGKKVSESIKVYAKLYKSVGSYHGRAYVRVGEPVEMRDLLEKGGLQGMANLLCDEINKITPISPRSFVASAFLSRTDEWVAKEEVWGALEVLMALAEGRKIPLGMSQEEISKSFESLVAEGHLTKEERGGKEGYKLKASGRYFLEYAKNMLIAHFLPEAIVSASLVSISADGTTVNEQAVRERSRFLDSLFGCEFVSISSPEWEARTEEATRCLCEVTPGGSLSWHRERALVFASLIRSKLEAYYVALCALLEVEPGAKMPKGEFIQLCFETHEELLGEGVLKTPESASKPSFECAIEKFSHDGLLACSQEESSADTVGDLIERLEDGGRGEKLKEELLSFLR